MSYINVLDKHTINQIAAGEVIERPASVVKELIENSIDAGATAVTCEIRGGGIDLIRITDNGSGIAADDIRTAFLRHATSKIKDASDLETVESLGFRGEALASIAAVSHVEVLTRCHGEVLGVRYLISEGEEESIESVGCPDGTTFLIKDLFANVPVRRKFLKAPVTEASYVTDLIEKIAISHPEVSIKYINNSRTAIFTSGSNSVKDIVYSVYGREITSALIPIDCEFVKGYVAKPVVARANRNLEHYFVNGRYIRNNVISKAIEDAYAPFLMQHKYPFTALLISIEPSLMDVNVHPTKQEVRFEHPEEIYNVVFDAVSSALKAALLIPKVITPDADEASKKNHDSNTDRSKTIPEPFEVARRTEIRPMEAKVSVTEQPEIEDIKVSVTEQLEIGYVSRTDTEEPESVADKASVSQEPLYCSEASSKEPAVKYEQLVFENDPVKENTVIRTESHQEFKKGLSDGYKIVGQIFNTYWIVERSDEMFIIDQHAAHEKIIYEKLVSQKQEHSIDTQMLSPALIVSLSASECELVERHIDDLHNMGYYLESFGGREYSVSAVPLELFGLDPTELLLEIISSFENEDRKKITVSINERLATCSCKAAVKGNNRLSREEARALIEQLLLLENPFNCPHGRPIIVNMTKSELEKKFKRII